jgi:hypothetical protein
MVEDMFEVSMRWPGRSCGTAGGTHSQLNRVGQQLNERSPETLDFETRAERDLMLVLHRPIEPTVISGHFVTSGRCPSALPPEGGHPTQVPIHSFNEPRIASHPTLYSRQVYFVL